MHIPKCFLMKPTGWVPIMVLSIIFSFSCERKKPIILDHWEAFDFTDTKALETPEIGEQQLVDFLSLMKNEAEDIQVAAFRNLLDHAVIHAQAFAFFQEKMPHYLNDPRSPMYDHELFGAYLKAIQQSKQVSLEEKLKQQVLLEQVHKNQPGSIAASFFFELENGKTSSLQQVHGQCIILLFFDPTCAHCQESILALKKQQDFANLLADRKSTFLMINPWGNYPAWKTFIKDLPENWVIGYDRPEAILKNGLYYLQASPSIYLLNKNREVLLKNTSIPVIIDYLASH